MKNKLIENIENNISKKVNELGFEIEYIEMVKEGGNNILRIVLDNPEKPVNIDDCETVSRAVEDDIDKLVKNEYVLEVSSPGLERQLKNINLYNKYIGNKIYVKLYKKIEYGKEFEAMLDAVNNDDETIEITLEDGNSIKLKTEDIASAHTVYDFSEITSKKDNVNLNKLNKFNKK